MKKLAAVAVVCGVLSLSAYNYIIELSQAREKIIHEKRKMCLTTRTEMGIFHPCSKREHTLKHK